MNRKKWHPRSVREGIRPPSGPFDGVPVHLHPALIHWLRRAFICTVGYSEEWDFPLMMTIASSVELHLPPNVEQYTSPNYLSNMKIFNAIIEECQKDEDKFLDAIDATLEFTKGVGAEDLEQILQAGGSSWRVSDDKTSLLRRVEEAAQHAADEVMRPNDVVSDELRSAWTAIYGRSPDASDAWDHAIKAVEAAYIPIVVPVQDRATMGHVIGRLGSDGDSFVFALSDKDESFNVDVLTDALRRLWPNPDRHAGRNRRAPSLVEAKTAVHLAVAVVQWARDGAVRKL